MNLFMESTPRDESVHGIASDKKHPGSKIGSRGRLPKFCQPVPGANLRPGVFFVRRDPPRDPPRDESVHGDAPRDGSVCAGSVPLHDLKKNMKKAHSILEPVHLVPGI